MSLFLLPFSCIVAFLNFFSYDYRCLSNQVANGSVEHFIDTARFVVLTVTRLFVQPSSFKRKFLFVQCCSAYIPACPEGSFFPSLLFVFATGLALSLKALDCRAGDPEFDILSCDLKSFFRLLSFPCSLK